MPSRQELPQLFTAKLCSIYPRIGGQRGAPEQQRQMRIGNRTTVGELVRFGLRAHCPPTRGAPPGCRLRPAMLFAAARVVGKSSA